VVEEPVQLGLVGEVPGERGLAGPRVDLEVTECVGEVLAEPPADDDPVAQVITDLLIHGTQRGTGPGERSPPREPVHPG